MSLIISSIKEFINEWFQFIYCSRIPETQHRLVHSEAGLSLQYKDEVAVIRMDDKKENRMNSPFVNEFHSLLDSVVGYFLNYSL